MVGIESNQLANLGISGTGISASKPRDHVFGGQPFGLGLEIGAEAVAEDGDGDALDVVDGDAEAAVHRGERLAAVDQELPGAGAGAPIDQVAGRISGPTRPWAASRERAATRT